MHFQPQQLLWNCSIDGHSSVSATRVIDMHSRWQMAAAVPHTAPHCSPSPLPLFTFAITFCLHGDNGQPIMWEEEGKRERATLPVRCSCHSPSLPLFTSLSVSPPTSIADSNVNCAMLSILFFLFLLGHWPLRTMHVKLFWGNEVKLFESLEGKVVSGEGERG